MVAANYGQVVARLGEVLTSEELFARFTQKYQPLEEKYSMPAARNFQVLVRMQFHDQGTVPGQYEIEDAWFDLDDAVESV